MADTTVFHDVTPILFACSKKYIEDRYRAKYTPPDADKGTATMSIDGHFPASPTTFDLNFDFSPSTGDLTYSFIQKQGYLPISAAWSVLADGIDACGGKGTQAQDQ